VDGAVRKHLLWRCPLSTFEGKSQLQYSSQLALVVDLIDSGINHSYMNWKMYRVVWQSVFEECGMCYTLFVTCVTNSQTSNFCLKLLSQSTDSFSKEKIIEEIHNLLSIMCHQLYNNINHKDQFLALRHLTMLWYMPRRGCQWTICWRREYLPLIVSPQNICISVCTLCVLIEKYGMNFLNFFLFTEMPHICILTSVTSAILLISHEHFPMATDISL
jgi:hypothetical protein